MKKKLKDLSFCFMCFLIITFLITHNKIVATTLIDAVNLFLRKVFVSLFPMLIINDILIQKNIPIYFYHLFKSIFPKIFKTSGIASYVLIMSLLSGTPSNAYILKELVNNKQIKTDEANHLLMFTYFSNPLFLSITLSAIFDTKTVIKIIIIHYISNIIIGILIRKKAPPLSSYNLIIRNENLNITSSIKKTMNVLFMILGTIAFYMLLNLIVSYPIKENLLFTTITSGFLEITSGLHHLEYLHITIKLKELIAISIISFGGISIHTQVKAILEESLIKYKYFLKGRIIHTIISIILIIII